METYGVEDRAAQQRVELDQIQRRLEILRLSRYGRRLAKEASSVIGQLEERERALEDALERIGKPRA